VAVTDVEGEGDEMQLVPEAPALESCPPRAIAVPAPANENAATEAISMVRNDFIGNSLMGSGVSEPFTPYIAQPQLRVTNIFLVPGNSKEVSTQCKQIRSNQHSIARALALSIATTGLEKSKKQSEGLHDQISDMNLR
jgi:hypothetical protein